ncbi:MAG TPA: class I SAM-dependent methyltransferase [Actinomycetes bacterium]|nr:class I SAM-dependent methyltransferase [Actinomycetes bacterium]
MLRQRPRRCSIPAPTPRPASVAFDRAAGYYDQTRGFPAEVTERTADLVEQAAGGTGARVLEIGVGTGRMSLPLHRRGRRAFGINLSAPMLERYRAKAAEEGLGAPAVVRGDATRLPFREASFDAVVEVHVLHLIPRWRAAVDEVRRVLVPGGTLVVARRLWDRSEGNGPRALVRRRHAQILAEWGVRARRIGVRGDDEMIAGFIEPGGRVEELEPVSWRESETWAEHLEILERRVWSESWQVPEDLWRDAAGRLRAELAAEGVDLHVPVTVERHVDLAAVHF